METSDRERCIQILDALCGLEEHAKWFMVPVDPIAHEAPGYFDVVKEPMDLGTVRSRLLENDAEKSIDFAEFCRLVRLVLENAITYNKGKNPLICASADALGVKFDMELLRLKSGSTQKNEGAGTQNGSSALSSATKSAEGGDDDANSGFLSHADVKVCLDALSKLRSFQCEDEANKGNFLNPGRDIFSVPVDTKAEKTYLDVIDRPMDLGTIEKRLKSGNHYKTGRAFAEDVMTVFTNSLVYLRDMKHPFRKYAELLLDEFERAYAPLRETVGAKMSREDKVRCRRIFEKVMLFKIQKGEPPSADAFWLPLRKYNIDVVEYRKKVGHDPICMSEILVNLNMHHFDDPDAFVAAVRRTFTNCIAYKKPIQFHKYTVIDLACALLAHTNTVYTSQRHLFTAYGGSTSAPMPSAAYTLGETKRRSSNKKRSRGAAASPSSSSTATSRTNDSVKRRKKSKATKVASKEAPFNKSWAQGVVRKLHALKYTFPETGNEIQCTYYFRKAVDTTHFPTYMAVLSKAGLKPMCFDQIEARVRARRTSKDAYKTRDDFCESVRMIFRACYAFNPETEPIYKQAQLLERTFESLVAPPPAKAPKESPGAATGQAKALSKTTAASSRVDAPTAAAASVVASVSSPPVVANPTKKRRRSGASGKRSRKRKGDKAESGGTKNVITIPGARMPTSAYMTNPPRMSKEVAGNLSNDEKAMDRIVNKLWDVCKKQEWGSVFQIPMIEIDPSMRRTYLARIDRPMDFRTIKDFLWVGHYSDNPESFRAHVHLVFENAKTFHEDSDPLSRDRKIRDYADLLRVSFDAIFEEFFYSQALVKKQIDALDAGRKEPALSAVEKKILLNRKKRQTEVKDMRDFPYGELSKTYKSCVKKDHLAVISPFMEPFDWKKYERPDYPEVIKNPMDFTSIRKKLNMKELGYLTPGDFERDCRLIVSNAQLYNLVDKDTPSSVYQLAEKLEFHFDRYWGAATAQLALERNQREAVLKWLRVAKSLELAKAEAERLAKEQAREEKLREEYAAKMKIERERLQEIEEKRQQKEMEKKKRLAEEAMILMTPQERKEAEQRRREVQRRARAKAVSERRALERRCADVLLARLRSSREARRETSIVSEGRTEDDPSSDESSSREVVAQSFSLATSRRSRSQQISTLFESNSDEETTERRQVMSWHRAINQSNLVFSSGKVADAAKQNGSVSNVACASSCAMVRSRMLFRFVRGLREARCISNDGACAALPGSRHTLLGSNRDALTTESTNLAAPPLVTFLNTKTIRAHPYPRMQLVTIVVGHSNSEDEHSCPALDIACTSPTTSAIDCNIKLSTLRARVLAADRAVRLQRGNAKLLRSAASGDVDLWKTFQFLCESGFEWVGDADSDVGFYWHISAMPQGVTAASRGAKATAPIALDSIRTWSVIRILCAEDSLDVSSIRLKHEREFACPG